MTIESILQEKKVFDTSLQLEKLGLDDGKSSWSTPSPTRPNVVASLPSRSNILHVAVFNLLLPAKENAQPYITCTTADRKLHLLDANSPNFEVVETYSTFQDSPILDVIVLDSMYMLIASMSGKLILFDTARNKVLNERKDHMKYIIKLASWSNGNSYLVASAAWDMKVLLYQLERGADGVELTHPFGVLELSTVPETLTFVQSPEDGLPIILLSRRDSSYLYYYQISSSELPAITLLGRQNLAPHSNAWVAFTPADVQLCPTDQSVVAVGTSSTPHMKLLIVRLLFPRKSLPSTITGSDPSTEEPITQASQARAELVLQDREEAAILVNVSTLAPQTQYSTPRLTWRPDGTGVFVSSDDGKVRGIEAKSGKLIHSLEGHDAGSKLRCLWAGTVPEDRHAASGLTDQELLISGGFDQKLIIWSP